MDVREKVCNRLFRPAAGREPVARILHSVVQVVDVPVMLKTRTGWTATIKMESHCANRGRQDSALAFTATPRISSATPSTNRGGDQVLDRIPVFANGDVDSPQRAAEILRATGCDGIMIGRAAQGRPWIFDEVNFFLTEGKSRANLALENVRDIMRAHLEDLYSFYGDEPGARVSVPLEGFGSMGQEDCQDPSGGIETPREQLPRRCWNIMKRECTRCRRLKTTNRWNSDGTMAAKKKAKSRREIQAAFNGRDLKVNGKGVPLRSQAEEALQCYFETLNGHKPAHLYDLVMREVEEPLFKVVMGHAQGNQSRAATILGINRGTLRKKLKEFGISE